MKKQTLFILFGLILCTIAESQTIMDVARSKSITWYGIDFSVAKFIKFEDKISSNEIKNTLINNWLASTAKTDFSHKYRIRDVIINTSTCARRNSEIDPMKIFSSTFYEINTEKIENIVKQYETSGTGYGFLFIVESFERSTDKVYIYVCYFNEMNKKIISLRRYIGEGFGIGIENHFANGIDNVITSSSKDFKKYSKR